MLHEVLLALSGHPSPLFEDVSAGDSVQSNTDGPIPLLSPSEKALLQSIGRLSEIHRNLRQHISTISAQHKSIICRAVATSIQHSHLARFQRKIIEVESRILSKDASIVGAYDIVPLAGVVAEFDDWHRLMAWYWELACFMEDTRWNLAASEESRNCTGATVIDRLRDAQQTGFPEIEQAAIDLSRAAETAWLRQLSSWIVYGKLPLYGTEDFFVHGMATDDENVTQFVKVKRLAPKFVTSTTASSILSIGKSLHQVQKHAARDLRTTSGSGSSASISDLATEHLQQLSALSLPILSAQLSRTVTTIRLSLSKNVLRHLLPMETTLGLLACLKEFFLLSRGDFAAALIQTAESRMLARQASMSKLLQQNPVKALQGLSIKDAEMQATILQTLKTLEAQEWSDGTTTLDLARRMITLGTPTQVMSRPTSSDSAYGSLPDLSSVAFNDLLFPTAASLNLTIPDPLHLFISSQDVQTYSSINAYLLGVERAYYRLVDLWKQTPARREPAQSRDSNADIKVRNSKRRIASRKIWATCSASIFMLGETARYFEGEIIEQSWNQFESWVRSPAMNDDASDSAPGLPPSSENLSYRDPETLSSGHRTFLAALGYALLLTDIPYTRGLRSLLGNIDNFIAFFTSVLRVQQKLDLEHDSGGETAYTLSEERRLSLELDRARKKVDSDLKSVLNRLRQLDHERIGSGRYLDVGTSRDGGFEPWKGGGVDRLLMKLEFGKLARDDLDLV